MRILLVEDSTTDTLLVLNALDRIQGSEVVAVKRLSEALAQLKENSFDVVLTDLGLPDSYGMETLHSLYPHCHDAAVVVMTVDNSPNQGLLALRSGSQDYLDKSHLTNPEAIRRCLVYARERRRHVNEIMALERELEAARKRKSASEESAFWDDLAKDPRLSMTGQKTQIQPSTQLSPRSFEELSKAYADVLERSVEMRFSNNHKDVGPAVSFLAQNLGLAGASPRDVVGVHVRGLRLALDKPENSVRPQLFVEESRFRLVELMGYLAMYYRDHKSADLKS